MSLLLEIPTETETLLREAAAREGRDVEVFIIDAAREKARQSQLENEVAIEFARQVKADAALNEITSLTEELELYDWQLDGLLNELDVPSIGLSDHALTRASFYED